MMSEVIQFEVGVMQNFCYLIDVGYGYVVVDPSYGYHKIKSHVGGKKIIGILLTHGHFDHVNDVPLLVAEWKCKVYIHAADLKYLPFKIETVGIEDGSVLDFGEKIKIIHTPGHTPGSVCYLFKKNIFTGDTLFAGCCGRVDLDGSDPMQMRESLIRLSELDDETVVFPGHNYNLSRTTIKDEKRTNLFIKAAHNKDEFLSIVL